jgi:polyhydroxybutyrate depolymerase
LRSSLVVSAQKILDKFVLMTNRFLPALLSALAASATACSTDTPDSVDAAPVIGGDAQRDSGTNTPDAATYADAASGDAARTEALDAAGPVTRDPPDAAAVDAAQESGSADGSTNGAPDAGSGDAGRGAAPSAGCGKSARPSSGRVSVQGDHNYTFPSSYDGMRPFPLLIGFHAASNPIEQIENLTRGSDFEQSFVRAFPKSAGPAWDYDADIGKVLAMYDDLMANYCIDTKRVFATGHSSGAQLIVQILTPARKAHADHLDFRAVAPVAASRYGTVSRAIPVLYIHGEADSVRRSDGADVVREFVAANACMSTTKPYQAAPSCMSGNATVNHGW